MKREVGYYWVSVSRGDEPEIAYWNGDYWQAIGDAHSYNDGTFDEIDPTPITR